VSKNATNLKFKWCERVKQVGLAELNRLSRVAGTGKVRRRCGVNGADLTSGTQGYPRREQSFSTGGDAQLTFKR
jgi:hypothetical protein